MVIISGVERSLDTESGGGGRAERSCLQDHIFAGIRNGKQVSTRGPFKTPVLPKTKWIPWQEDVLTRPMSLVAESKRRLYTPPWIKFGAGIFSKWNSRSIGFCAEFPSPFGRREGIGKNGEEKDERPWWPPKECRKEADQDIPITKKKERNEQTNERRKKCREREERKEKEKSRKKKKFDGGWRTSLPAEFGAFLLFFFFFLLFGTSSSSPARHQRTSQPPPPAP